MWNIFVYILLGCLGVLAIAFTLIILIAIIYVIKEQM